MRDSTDDWRRSSRLLRFDKRGTGMSDRLVELPSLDTRMDDVRAVLDAVGSERAVLFATGDGGFLATVFVATYPERAWGLSSSTRHPASRVAPTCRGYGRGGRRWRKKASS